MQHDFLQTFLFAGFPARGAFVRLNQSWAAIQATERYPEDVAEILGQSLAASALLTSHLKYRGTLGLQIQSQGALRLLLAQSNDLGDLRGIARLDPEASRSRLLVDAVLAINLEPAGRGEPYQGIVPLEGGSISQSLEHYFLQSEQLETRFWLMADAHSAVGLMVQRMPGEKSQDGDDDWRRIGLMADTATADELKTLATPDLLKRLFNEDDIRLYDSTPLRFRCSCSAERVAGMLTALGEKEVRETLADTNPISVHCEYCNQKYQFDELDVSRLFSADGFAAPGSGQA